MKKAVILVGGKQYLVAEKETLRVDLLPAGTKELELDALLVTDGDKTIVGTHSKRRKSFSRGSNARSKGRQNPRYPLQSEEARSQRNWPSPEIQRD